MSSTGVVLLKRTALPAVHQSSPLGYTSLCPQSPFAIAQCLPSPLIPSLLLINLPLCFLHFSCIPSPLLTPPFSPICLGMLNSHHFTHLSLCIFKQFCTRSYLTGSPYALMSDSTALNLLSLSVFPPSCLFASLHLYLLLSWLMWAGSLYQCFIRNPNNICLCLHFWKSKSTPDTICWQRIHTRENTHTSIHPLIINGLFLKVMADKTKMLHVVMWGNISICMCACGSASRVYLWETEYAFKWLC